MSIPPLPVEVEEAATAADVLTPWLYLATFAFLGLTFWAVINAYGAMSRDEAVPSVRMYAVVGAGVCTLSAAVSAAVLDGTFDSLTWDWVPAAITTGMWALVLSGLTLALYRLARSLVKKRQAARDKAAAVLAVVKPDPIAQLKAVAAAVPDKDKAWAEEFIAPAWLTAFLTGDPAPPPDLRDCYNSNTGSVTVTNIDGVVLNSTPEESEAINDEEPHGLRGSRV